MQTRHGLHGNYVCCTKLSFCFWRKRTKPDPKVEICIYKLDVLEQVMNDFVIRKKCGNIIYKVLSQSLRYATMCAAMIHLDNTISMEHICASQDVLEHTTDTDTPPKRQRCTSRSLLTHPFCLSPTACHTTARTSVPKEEGRAIRHRFIKLLLMTCQLCSHFIAPN